MTPLLSEPWSQEWVAKLLDETEWAWAVSTAPTNDLYLMQAKAILAALPQHPVIAAREQDRQALALAGLPLETLLATECDSKALALSDDVKAAIAAAVAVIRARLAEPAGWIA